MNFHRDLRTNWKYILVVVILTSIVGAGIFYQWRALKEEIKIPEDKIPEKITKDGTANWQTYRNEEYGFETKYPEKWFYKEFPPKPVTTSYRKYDPVSKEYKYSFVKELTDYTVTFGVDEVSVPTALRGGLLSIGIEIYDGSMEQLLSLEKERNLEHSKEPIQLSNGYSGFKIEYRARIPDATEPYHYIEVRFEENNKVFKIVLVDHDDNRSHEDIYWGIVNSFKFIQ